MSAFSVRSSTLRGGDTIRSDSRQAVGTLAGTATIVSTAGPSRLRVTGHFKSAPIDLWVNGAARLDPLGAGMGIEVVVVDGTTLRAAKGTDPVGNEQVVTGLAETLLPGCDITVSALNGRVRLDLAVSLSQYGVGVAKQATLRLRRTSTVGAVVWSFPFPDVGDSRDGHQQTLSTTIFDQAPTDGRYVLTIQETAGDGSTEIWSDTRQFSARCDGNILAILEGARQARWNTALNDIGAGSFMLSTSDPKSAYLVPGNLIRFRLHGVDRFAMPIDAPERVIASVNGRSGEYWKVAGRSAIGLLDRGKVAPNAGAATAEPAAALLANLMDQSSTNLRPALLAIVRDFDAVHDSEGLPWLDAATWSIANGESLLNVWRQLTALGIETRMTPGLKLQAYRDGFGTDRSGTVVVQQGRHVRSEVTQAFPYSERITRAWVEGASGSALLVYGNEADPRFIREGYVKVDSTDEPSVLQQAGLVALEESDLAASAFHVPLLHDRDAGGLEPYLDYDVGDTVGTSFPDFPDVPARPRIVALTIEATDQGGEYMVDADFNSVRVDQLVRLKRAFDKSQASAFTG